MDETIEIKIHNDGLDKYSAIGTLTMYDEDHNVTSRTTLAKIENVSPISRIYALRTISGAIRNRTDLRPQIARCAGCGKLFKLNRTSHGCQKKYCSTKCENRYSNKKYEVRVCRTCGRQFLYLLGKKAQPKDYCSKECQQEGNRKAARERMRKITKERRKLPKKYTKVCPWCGKQFKTNMSYKVYCCSECQCQHNEYSKKIKHQKSIDISDKKGVLYGYNN